MTPHYLRFAIAVISAAGAGCAGSQTEVATAPPVSPSASASASSSAVVPSEEPPNVAQGDPTEGTGACRCSWEAKPQGIARVCRVGEHSHTGAACIRATRPKYGGVMLGPLSPPDLSPPDLV